MASSSQNGIFDPGIDDGRGSIDAAPQLHVAVRPVRRQRQITTKDLPVDDRGYEHEQ